jgi:hypothetical protein
MLIDVLCALADVSMFQVSAHAAHYARRMTRRLQQDRYEAAIEDNQQALQLCVQTGATKAKVKCHMLRITRHTSHSMQLLDVHYQIGLGYISPITLTPHAHTSQGTFSLTRCIPQSKRFARRALPFDTLVQVPLALSHYDSAAELCRRAPVSLRSSCVQRHHFSHASHFPSPRSLSPMMSVALSFPFQASYRRPCDF